MTLPRDLAIFRMAALVTGVGLLFLVLVAIPLRYLGDEPGLSKAYSPIHGVIFMGYVVVVVWLASRRRWTPGRTLLVVLAGVVPFASFVVERRVVAAELARSGRSDPGAAAGQTGGRLPAPGDS